jgi:hypothetical protein
MQDEGSVQPVAMPIRRRTVLTASVATGGAVALAPLLSRKKLPRLCFGSAPKVRASWSATRWSSTAADRWFLTLVRQLGSKTAF